MKQFLTQTFVALGVIFLFLILVGVYLFITDPYDLKPLLFGSPQSFTERSNVPQKDAEGSTEARSGFELSFEQRQALTAFGVDPSSVPTTISREQETCFVGVLGATRVAEIKGGAVPNALELLKAKTCI